MAKDLKRFVSLLFKTIKKEPKEVLQTILGSSVSAYTKQLEMIISDSIQSKYERLRAPELCYGVFTLVKNFPHIAPLMLFSPINHPEFTNKDKLSKFPVRNMILNDDSADAKYTFFDYLVRLFLVIDNEAFFNLLLVTKDPLGFLVELQLSKDGPKYVVDIMVLVQFKILNVIL
eukprot:CAMPEP_0114579964 /NCGR_PEP_ID=MMETSP0125-20121206/4298_1 /TAXON_ID=485358 ORGANISM="Aristerostoma sp., Strain ATCC 50986" /NCGR_SAMPLE_ID=MMETSP0125 /ASSEMBLY_ACC=CAM_ASM_000245 /LENGTH=173 /DNA_ID=CAMNT_0001771149 /DNA_START=2013 /DNA_END=2534 /DNA_ORIENTATION=-